MFYSCCVLLSPRGILKEYASLQGSERHDNVKCRSLNGYYDFSKELTYDFSVSSLCFTKTLLTFLWFE